MIKKVLSVQTNQFYDESKKSLKVDNIQNNWKGNK